MIRICLIVAIVAGLAVAVVNFIQVKEVITTTRTNLNNTSNELVTTQTTLSKTKKELDGTKAELATTKDTLKTTEDERNKALADAEDAQKKATKLKTDLDKTTGERDDAQRALAKWTVLGIGPEQVKTALDDLKEAQDTVKAQREENRVIAISRDAWKAKYIALVGPDPRTPLPENLKATIVAVDPKWEFVVLDVGKDQGAITNGELLISRNGKLVAKVRISAVQQQRCIANVVSGWKLGDIVEGDSAIPAFTGS